MTTDLPVPDESRTFLRQLVESAYWGGDENTPEVPLSAIQDTAVQVVARPVVVAELLALAEKVAALYAAGDDRYNAGHDAAIGAVRELIADRCDELGTRVEEL